MNAKAQTEYPKNITRGSILSPNTINSSWPSPSGLFSFGFYPEGNGFRVGIWMATDKPETRVVVWTANPDVPPCSPDATLELKGRLVLRTEQGEEKNVTYNDDLPDPATSAAMLDDGNFQLFNGSGYLMWQSFDYPTDTILGGQVLTSDSWLQSSISRSDHSSGLFMLRMQNDGNLVCYPANISNNPDTAYWSSGTFSYAAMLNLSHLGYLSLEGSYGKPIRFLSNGSYPVKNKTIIHRATLDSDGIFRKYSHYIVSNVSSKVTEKWSSMQNPCDVKGICGLNSFCQVVNNKSECSCYPGFVSVEPSMMFLGCYQNFSAESYGDKEEADPALRYNFTSLNNIRWDDPPYTVEILMEEACKGSCMNDFNCWAVLYESTRCRKYNFPLRYGKQSKDITTKALFKVKNIGMAKESNHNHPAPANDESRIKTVMFILGLSLGSVACLCFAFAVSSFIAYKHKYHRYVGETINEIVNYILSMTSNFLVTLLLLLAVLFTSEAAQQPWDGFAIGIWLVGGDDITVVWTANRDDPPITSSNATLSLDENGKLLLRTNDGQKEKIIVNTTYSATSASMLDSGNFVLCNRSGHVIWESFQNPTDTLLGGQVLHSGHQLFSSLSETDRSTGRFRLKMQVDELSIGNGSYFRSSLYSSSEDNQNGTIYLATIDANGIFKLYSHAPDKDGKLKKHDLMWPALKNPCEVKGFVGLTAFALFDDQPNCVCLPGSDYIDVDKKTLGCLNNHSDGGCIGGKENVTHYNIAQMENIIWPDFGYMEASMSMEECNNSCLTDCNCWAALFKKDANGKDVCTKQKLPLRYVRRNDSQEDPTTSFSKWTHKNNQK
ncbi:hypothetical protein FEM48_ZijujUnG0111100 [Ziziphus jujuba var. spinosa]|uniref:Bulb-type lectin domain-containing protein n=1 Tax=Ziziphus jujuba var. spinosa TaxID=714518 RepID=A0A978U810_ZIZJJ|nr:hypothetical protein FEM48_ZijujUnG0111100 [Ziziphus jujuba var. spinosa]